MIGLEGFSDYRLGMALVAQVQSKVLPLWSVVAPGSDQLEMIRLFS